MTLPNFIYIGPAKAGSTWLHETLVGHPDIYLPAVKDLHFFNRYYERGVDWYAGHFASARAEQGVIGEVCQSYLATPEAAERMSSCLGKDLRLMVTLRNPVQRAFSHYLYMLRQGERPQSFHDALVNRGSLIKQSRYARDLRRYLRYFPRESIYLGVFEDLRANPQAFLDDVLTWLRVAPMTLTSAQRNARLPASKARSRSAARTLHRSALWARNRDRATWVGWLKRSRLVERLFYQRVDETPTMTEADAAYIRAMLDDDVSRLEDTFGTALRTRWGWPEVAPTGVDDTVAQQGRCHQEVSGTAP
ncbi:MAG: sulfotransferase domain-containing protein [Streptosporangiales bacterium]